MTPRWRAPGYRWYALGLLAAINILNYLDRNVIFALFEPIKRDLGLSDAQLGWLGSAYIIVFSLAALPAGVLSDLRSRRAVIAGGVAVWSAFTFFSGLARSFGQLFIFRAAVGVGEAAYGPASSSLVADYFPGDRRALAMGLLSSGVALGGVLGLILGGLLEQIYGWRVAFMAVALPGFLCAFLAARLLDPTRPPSTVSLRASLRQVEVGLAAVLRQFWPILTSMVLAAAAAWYMAKWKGADSALDVAVAGLVVGLGLALNILLWSRALRDQPPEVAAFGQEVSGAFGGMLLAIRLVLRTPTLGYLFVGGAMISFGMNGLVGWGPTFLSRELGLDPGSSATLLGFWGLLAGTAGTITGGYISDWLRGSRWLARAPGASRVVTVAFGVVVGGILTMVLLFVRDLRLFGPLFSLAFFFLTWYNGPIAAALFDVVPPRIGATVMGAFLLFIHLAGDAIAFPLVGALSDRFGIQNAVMLLPVVAILGGLVTLLAGRTVAYDIGRAASRVTGNFPTLP